MIKLFFCITLYIYQCSEQATAYQVPSRLLSDEADQVRYISPAFLESFVELVADDLGDIDKSWKEEQARKLQLVWRMEAMKQKMATRAREQIKKEHFDLMHLKRNQGVDGRFNGYRNYRRQQSRQVEWQREQERLRQLEMWQKVQPSPKTLSVEPGPQWIKMRTGNELPRIPRFGALSTDG